MRSLSNGDTRHICMMLTAVCNTDHLSFLNPKDDDQSYSYHLDAFHRSHYNQLCFTYRRHSLHTITRNQRLTASDRRYS
jgi:hypothetical protein